MAQKFESLTRKELIDSLQGQGNPDDIVKISAPNWPGNVDLNAVYTVELTDGEVVIRTQKVEL